MLLHPLPSLGQQRGRGIRRVVRFPSTVCVRGSSRVIREIRHPGAQHLGTSGPGVGRHDHHRVNEGVNGVLPDVFDQLGGLLQGKKGVPEFLLLAVGKPPAGNLLLDFLPCLEGRFFLGLGVGELSDAGERISVYRPSAQPQAARRVAISLRTVVGETFVPREVFSFCRFARRHRGLERDVAWIEHLAEKAFEVPGVHERSCRRSRIFQRVSSMARLVLVQELTQREVSAGSSTEESTLPSERRNGSTWPGGGNGPEAASHQADFSSIPACTLVLSLLQVASSAATA